jgi:hypothetical protein
VFLFTNQKGPIMFKTTVALLVLSASLTGCISPKMYVDATLPKVNYADLQAPASKHPVQLLYEFQTKGAVNAAAIKQTQPVAFATLQKTGLFSEVVTAPTTSDYKLLVTINNVPVTQDAASKGFATGLTLGLAGTTVTDGYICTATYQGPGQQPVVKTYNHAIHTTIGNTDAPKGLQPAKPQDAVNQIVEDLILNTVSDLGKEGVL